MKYLLALLLASLLLSGCSADIPAPQASLPQESTDFQTASALEGLWDPGSPLEIQTEGAVRVYPLNNQDAYGLLALNESILVLSGTQTTTLTRLAGEELYPAASAELPVFLSAEDPSLQIWSSGMSYFDPQRQQTVLLDISLKEIRHLAAPEGLTGVPLLGEDQDTLYYCTDDAIRVWDMTTGIHRILRETDTSGLTLTGLYLQDSILLCHSAKGVQVIRALDGSIAWEGTELTLTGTSGTYYASLPAGVTQALVFGRVDDEPTALTPSDLYAQGTFFPRQDALVTVSTLSQTQIRLDYYALSSGHRVSCLPLNLSASPAAMAGTAEGWIYLLVEDPDYGCYAIYRWDPDSPAINDGNCYTGPYYTAAAPDYHGLLSCQAEAQRIGARFGINIHLWDETESVSPWDYTFQPEYMVPLLQQELDNLEQRLEAFPEGFLETTAGNFSSLNIYLVRSITGTAESGSLDRADGIQYFNATDACIALAVGKTSEKALYHELYHVMETQILNKSIALDQWDKLNPADFSYSYDYSANTSRDVGNFLDDDIRSFIDLYSMSFPKEDRARIFEYAMISGSESLFASSPLQYKLKQLCIGIREAYGLKKSPEEFPWEQYLIQSLAYTNR